MNLKSKGRFGGMILYSGARVPGFNPRTIP